MEKAKPIGVFDSGIGGLTVVRKLSSTLPNENIVYFGDTARVPYGSKSNETVIEYSIQNTKFLIEKNVKAVVVACNTASSVAIPELRKRFSIPIIEMINPGATAALKATRNNKIGVIGTRATINNKAYSKEIKKFNENVEVFEVACPLFVPLAEEGWIDHKATYEIAEEYLKPFKEFGIDTLVLGCTHYPILAKVIQEVIGDDVMLIDSGVASSEIVRAEIDRIGLTTNSNTLGNQNFYVSDLPIKFKEIAELFLGREIKNVQKVDVEHLVSLG
ncbi:MAG: glutamate racemase [Chlorobiaceae bacterium]|nr:glutamate racemase [Chlorobiaceae bacterium]MBA4310205.1 glutamate racemase [Chlorobiaceae bacterium]